MDSDEPLSDRVVRKPVQDRIEVFDGHVWDVVSERIDLGHEIVTRDFVEHSGAVAVIPYREPGEVLVLKQYRHPVGRELWEPPAGLLDVAGEDPLETAKRELHEEADLTADTWHVLLDVFSSPGGSSEAIRLYLARDLNPVPEAERHVRDAEEHDIEARWISLEQALEAVASGRFRGPTAVMGFLAVDAARRSGWSTLRPADAPWSGLNRPPPGASRGRSRPARRPR
ncbi:MAG: NUDIX hydrolase [Demequinaceae bacterium]|nr:NUDIX hydrolase [Demequinaceae bacterium]